MTSCDRRKLVRVKAVHVPELQSPRDTQNHYVFDLIVDENAKPCGNAETLGYYCFPVGGEFTDRKPIRILPDLHFLDYEIVFNEHRKKREIEHRNRISEDIVARVGCRFLMWEDDEYEYEVVEVIDVFVPFVNAEENKL